MCVRGGGFGKTADIAASGSNHREFPTPEADRRRRERRVEKEGERSGGHKARVHREDTHTSLTKSFFIDISLSIFPSLTVFIAHHLPLPLCTSLFLHLNFQLSLSVPLFPSLPSESLFLSLSPSFSTLLILSCSPCLFCLSISFFLHLFISYDLFLSFSISLSFSVSLSLTHTPRLL